MRRLRWAVMAGTLAWGTACGGRVLVEKQDESPTLPLDGGARNVTSSGGSSGTKVPATGTGGFKATGGSTGTTTTPGPPLGAGGRPGTGGVTSVPPIASTTTKPPPPAPSEGDAGMLDYALAGVTDSGKVLAAFWNGSDEEIVLVDPSTGQSTAVGKLGNLQRWPFRFIYDSKATAYTVGQDANSANYVYSFSFDDHRTTSVPLEPADGAPANYMLGGVTSTGMLIAGHGTNAVYYLDPKTGAATFVGMFDGLTGWIGQLQYDDAKRTAYMLGSSGSSDVYYLFSLNLDTGKNTRFYVGSFEAGPINYAIGGFSMDGRLVGAYWDGSAEKAILIDPGTGTIDVVGTFGNLTTWGNQLVYGGVGGTAIAYGHDPSGNARFYQVAVGK